MFKKLLMWWRASRLAARVAHDSWHRGMLQYIGNTFHDPECAREFGFVKAFQECSEKERTEILTPLFEDVEQIAGSADRVRATREWISRLAHEFTVAAALTKDLRPHFAEIATNPDVEGGACCHMVRHAGSTDAALPLYDIRANRCWLYLVFAKHSRDLLGDGPADQEREWFGRYLALGYVDASLRIREDAGLPFDATERRQAMEWLLVDLRVVQGEADPMEGFEVQSPSERKREEPASQ